LTPRPAFAEVAGVTLKLDVPSTLCGGAAGEGFGPVADVVAWGGESSLAGEIARPDLVAISKGVPA
jgi:hypothetical protein